MTDLQRARAAHRPLSGLALGAMVLLLGLPAAAQDDASGGPRLDVTLGLTLSNNDNPDLLPADFADPQTTANLSLGFALTTETARSKFSFSGAGDLRISADTAGTGAGTGTLVNPALGLSWDYGVKNSSLAFSANHSDTDLSTQSATASDFGAGNRISNSVTGALALGTQAPLGATLSMKAEQTDYRDADAALVGRRSASVGLDLRADVFEVWQANLGISGTAFQSDGAARRDTRAATLGLSYQRTRSTSGISFGLTDTPEGRRQSLSLDHQLELPSGDLSFSLSGARGVSGADNLTGALRWSQTYASGTLALDLSRALVSSDTSDDETLETTAGLQWSQEVTPTGALLLGLSYADEAPTSGSGATTTSQIAATWSQQIGQDWALDLGVTHALRETSSFSGQSNLISLGISRDFSLRF